jgi:predicted alpha-1,6-mannanase (GH76 family)
MRTLRMRTSTRLLFFASILVTLCVSRVNAQMATFGPLAETVQTSTHNLFINSSGNYYNQDNSPITTFHYWRNSHGIDVFIDGYLRTRDSKYLTRSKNLLRGIKLKHGSYKIDYYDDMEWLAISSLRAYEITKDVEYLNVANELWGYIKLGLHTNSFQWSEACPDCRNTPANTPAVIFAARLYRVTGNAADLQIAKDVYAWVKSILVDPVSGAVWDKYDAGTGVVSKSRYSYNQGTFVGAALELYKITGDMTYMSDAIKTADYAITNQIGGVLYPNSGGGDGGLFNGILVRYLALFAREGNIAQNKRDEYINIIKSTATAMKVHPANNTIDSRWSTPPADEITDFSSQLSGVMLIEAAATFDRIGINQHLNYGGYTALLSEGNYNLSQLQANGVVNDDATSITIPAGLMVIGYNDDNFMGSSTIFSTNQPWLNTWNDKISSARVLTSTSAFSHTIEAENYTAMSGVIKETCSEGGQNIGSFGAGDWMTYDVSVPFATTYKISYRVASVYSGKTMQIQKDGVTLGTITIPNTTNWQIWTSVSHTIALPAGTYTLKLTTTTGGLNINRFNLNNNLAARSAVEEVAPLQPTPEGVLHENSQSVYPNPFKSAAKVRVNIIQPGHTEVDMFNSTGCKTISIYNGHLTTGIHEFEFNSEKMPSGLYFYRVTQKGKRIVQKVLKE